MLRRFFIAIGALLAIGVVVSAGAIGMLLYSLARLDDYPAFMAELKHERQTYDQAKQAFSEFVSRKFPIGSSAEGVIATISGEGFSGTTSPSGSVGLVWNRTAGPCREKYSIDIVKDAAGRIATISGTLYPICL